MPHPSRSFLRALLAHPRHRSPQSLTHHRSPELFRLSLAQVYIDFTLITGVIGACRDSARRPSQSKPWNQRCLRISLTPAF